MNSSNKLLVIKIAHTLIWLVFVIIIFYILYSGISNKINLYTWIAIGLIFGEGIVLITFKFFCPLTILAKKYSDSMKDNFDIFLPNWLARYNKIIFTTIFLIALGIVGRLSGQEYYDYIRERLGDEIAQALLNRDVTLGSNIPLIHHEGVGWVISPDHSPRLKNVFVTSNYIDGIPSIAETIIYANFCYSGFTDLAASSLEPFIRLNIPTAIGKSFLVKNPISYYCYTNGDGTSEIVDNEFCKNMEFNLILALTNNGDSTGVAHLKQNTEYYYNPPYRGRPSRLYFEQYLSDNYCYGKCTGPGSFIDDRDGQEYKMICIGDQTWMAENLNYEAPGSTCYNENEENGDTYGRLYTYTELMNGEEQSDAIPSGVKGICPDGWHVPSDDEWIRLETYLGLEKLIFEESNVNRGASIKLGIRMKDAEAWNETPIDVSNESGMSILPGGAYQFDGLGDYIYSGLGNTAIFWTASKNESAMWKSAYGRGFYSNASTEGVLRYTLTSGELMNGSGGTEYVRHSCRCVKD